MSAWAEPYSSRSQLLKRPLLLLGGTNHGHHANGHSAELRRDESGSPGDTAIHVRDGVLSASLRPSARTRITETRVGPTAGTLSDGQAHLSAWGARDESKRVSVPP